MERIGGRLKRFLHIHHFRPCYRPLKPNFQLNLFSGLKSTTRALSEDIIILQPLHKNISLIPTHFTVKIE